MAADGAGGDTSNETAGASEKAGLTARTIAAEGGGAGLLTLVMVAAGIAAERYAIGDIALALLITALCASAALFILLRTIGDLAPCRFNPALALAAALDGRLTPVSALSCAAVQIGAALIGVQLAHLITNIGLVQTATLMQNGPGVWSGEFVGTALFVFAMLAAMRRRPDQVALTGAVCLLVVALVTPSISLANPAVTLARALTDSFTAIRLTDAATIMAIQFAGGLAAWGLHRWLYAER